MRKVRIMVIVILAVCLVALGGLLIAGKTAAKTTTSNENVTIVEAPQQTEPMEHEAFKIEEYISVLPEGENIIRDGKLDANNYNDVYVPRKAADGNTKGVSYWEGGVGEYPNILSVSFRETKTVHAMRICLCPLPVWGDRVQTFSVEITTDGENYTELVPETDYQFSPKTGNEVILEFDTTDIMGAQLIFTGNTGAASGQVAEWEIYSAK